MNEEIVSAMRQIQFGCDRLIERIRTAHGPVSDARVRATLIDLYAQMRIIAVAVEGLAA